MADDEQRGGPGRADARFLLANERTYLAWSRTALALVAAGLAVTQLLDRTPLVWARLLGVPLIVAGGVVAWSGYRRRAAVERALRSGADLPPTRLPAFLAAVIVGGACVAVLLALTAPRG